MDSVDLQKRKKHGVFIFVCVIYLESLLLTLTLMLFFLIFTEQTDSQVSQDLFQKLEICYRI